MIKLLALIFLISCAHQPVTSPVPPPVAGNPTATWAVQYNGPLIVRDTDYQVVDLFNYSTDEIKTINRPICYFSSQYEDFRPDSKDFLTKDIGKKLGSWKGEKWVNSGSIEIRKIMIKRLQMAKEKGCFGVDIDNLDFYSDSTGFPNSKMDAVNYVLFFCKEAHSLGMFFALKNSLLIIKDVSSCVDFYINESCQKFGECGYMNGVNRPVLNLEYSDCKKVPGMYSIKKDQVKMDAWDEVCK